MDAGGLARLHERHDRLQSQRGDTIHARIDVIGRRSALQQRICDCRQAQDRLLGLLQSVCPSATESEQAAGMLSAISSIQQLQEGLGQDLEQTKQLEQTLSSLEFDLGREENAFFGDLHAAVSHLAPAAEPEHPRSTTAEARGDGLLQAYYDRASEVPILEERLSELEYTFADERAQRETRTNLGQPISPPDLEFYTQYNQDKEDLQRESDQTRSEVAALRSRCIRLGLIPEPPEPPSVGAGPAALPEEEIHRARSWAHPPQPANELDRSFLSERPTLPGSLRGNPRERINVWLEEARAIAGAPELLPPEDYPETKASQTGAAPPSPLESPWSEVEEAQPKLSRTVSESSTASKLSRTGRDPPQKAPKPS